MDIQIDIGTYCNYNCFYCAGRSMPQEFMTLERFTAILNEFPIGKHVVNLQGEGEPFMPPKFWEMVSLLKERGHTPTTITNGSKLDIKKIVEELGSLSISIDTLDPIEAERIGRKNLSKVLSNLDELLKVMSSVTIRCTNYGQDLSTLHNFAKSKRLKLIIQELQTKDDYIINYSNLIPIIKRNYHYNCKYLNRDILRTYSILGNPKPCVFIKDYSTFTTIKDLSNSLNAKIVPKTCLNLRIGLKNA